MILELEGTLKLDDSAIKSPNLCGRFSETDLNRIGAWVHAGYAMDVASRAQWALRNTASMDLAMQVVQAKTWPWPNASNVAFPLVTIATLQFHSRAYPAIISGTDVVQYRVIGEATPDDCARADRVGCHMSYQLLEEDADWEEQHDRMLINVPIVGCAFKKSFWKSDQIDSDLVLAQDLVLDYYAKSVETCQRKTHTYSRYRNFIYEMVKRGMYRDVLNAAWYMSAQPGAMAASEQENDRLPRTGQTPPPADHSTPFMLLEQHCWVDFDGDGYAEPYVITIDSNSQQVLRIVTRFDRPEDITRDTDGTVLSIRATEYFTKYGFIPSPDGGIYDMGFGSLLSPLNESVNTVINQLIDAGTMATTAGGFLGRGAKIRGGTYTFAPMEWKRVDSTGDDLQKSIFPLPVREPSSVLFQLLGLLIQYTDRISGSTEMSVGENPGQNTKVGTAEAMIEQGQKVYAAIFKRIWRSMKEEFKKLYKLNAVHFSEAKLPSGIGVSRADYLGDPNKVVPVADPNVVSDSVRMIQAQMIAQRAMQVPGYDPTAVEVNFLRALKVDAWQRFYKGPQPAGPSEKLQLEQMRQQSAQMKMQMEDKHFMLELMEEQRLNNGKILELQAQATQLEAQAEVAGMDAQVAVVNAALGALKHHNDVLDARIGRMLEGMGLHHEISSNGGNPERVAAASGNGSFADAMSGMGGQPNGGMALGGLPS